MRADDGGVLSTYGQFGQPPEPVAPPASAASRVVIRRGCRLRRWHLHTWFRRYHGLGLPAFEFEFRVGRVWDGRGKPWPEMIVYEDDSELAFACERLLDERAASVSAGTEPP